MAKPISWMMSFLLVFLFATHAASEKQIFTPRSVAIHQPLKGFVDILTELDADVGMLNFEQEWVTFTQADVWVFFLKNSTDRTFLPKFAEQLLDKKYTPRDGALQFKKITVTDDRPVTVLFAYLDLLTDEDRELSVVSCFTANALYKFLKNGKLEATDIDPTCK